MVRKSNSQYETFDILIHEIWVDDEFNCRGGISRHSVDSMVKSIEREGLAYPVDVQTGEGVEGLPQGFKFRLVCGFRRLTACKLLGWTVIPARIREGLTDYSAAFMNLTENLERKNLNILEEAIALDKLFEVYRTTRSIAQELNKPENWVSIRRRLLLLPHWIQKVAASGRFTETDLGRIWSSADHEGMARVILRAIKKGNKTRTLNSKAPPKKSDVKNLVIRMLKEGFSPELLRFISWTIGEISDEELEKALVWLRDRKGWLK